MKGQEDMEYQLLSEDEQHEMLAATLVNQERDHYMHTINLERYKTMLANMGPQHDYRLQIQKLHDETAGRLDEVTHIHKALVPQLPPAAKLKAAMARIKAKAAKG